jgi:tyrosine-protein phosphatase non-receptor type 9
MGGLPEMALGGARLLEQLQTGFIRLMPRCDNEGRAVIHVRLKLHDKSKFTPDDTKRAWHYLVMRALARDARTQARGVIFVSDMHDSTMANLDPAVPKAIIGALRECVPMRVHNGFIVRPRWFFSLVFPIVRAFMSEKMKRRIHNLGDDLEDLCSRVSPSSILPRELGGEAFPDDAASGKNDQWRGVVERWRAEDEAAYNRRRVSSRSEELKGGDGVGARG